MLETPLQETFVTQDPIINVSVAIDRNVSENQLHIDESMKCPFCSSELNSVLLVIFPEPSINLLKSPNTNIGT